ncbi:uncharacterized protein TRIVIDRAFT_183402 [Trichoderma virens Gv29-8]|uniref:Rhodanese domain-containing protein n=1 Tax=Hypocrea virens (strain Gv29-8 / FGSC 10586) TaxID=413071 RepID=G9N7U8_HYPVG|nr:uncharacterized protein TRIVIDRAFT_183402 [Trichoderma virens Gv29-8]EHK17062.1 hypothetical protein TRIVIDRAFT_183402 [Trichoderma virens Gv29-8]UKZ55474.1 hypothetical protein TrVGV298_009298 [Trichoderma virens]
MSGQPYVTIRGREDGVGIRNGAPVPQSAARAFPNRGRASQRYKNVQALLVHWGSDDLFVLPELEDLEKCMREDYAFGTDIFSIPSENSHLELMMRIGQLIKDHESPDTLFIMYYGGHARIDESRQSTWCATRDPDSPWLQWSAIQTLLERSKSDVLILLDCCAGAASATFPTGNSITETISASSWDAIAPDPGRYSFTNALIEVLQEWRHRVFSAAMLHAEVLARLKHPRPITINGKHFEARSTPVHFMMTANHKAPSIELSRTMPEEKRSHSVPTIPHQDIEPMGGPVGGQTPPMITAGGRAANPADALVGNVVPNEPTEDTPHVMISLALEDDQRLDINAWEQWLNAFPAMARYVKIQGVFKSHSTLVLVSMPVMIWDLLPEDPATSFVAFIRSNNIAAQKPQPSPITTSVPASRFQSETVGPDSASFMSGVSGTTFAPTEASRFGSQFRSSFSFNSARDVRSARNAAPASQPGTPQPGPAPSSSPSNRQLPFSRSMSSATSLPATYANPSSLSTSPVISRQMILNQQQSQRRTTFGGSDVPEPQSFSAHVEKRLEEYYQRQPLPNDGESAFLASNLGIEPFHLGLWFHHRRERDLVTNRLATMKVGGIPFSEEGGPLLILPADLSRLLEISQPGQTLLFDIRSPSDYQRSHIRDAVNLRVPQNFIRDASPEMIGRTISEEHGHEAFSKWQEARCIVFYSRGLESAWECPSATSLLRKLSEFGWTGRSFVLKGHYREFSASFGQYIVDSKSPEADNAQQQSGELSNEAAVDPTQNHEQYSQWLAHVEAEDRSRMNASSPTRTTERTEFVESQEHELEAELMARCGDLYRKIQDVQAGRDSSWHDNFDIKAPMVEYLDRGLNKMRAYQPSPQQLPPSSKLAAEGYFDRPPPELEDGDDYVEITKGSGSTGVSRSGVQVSAERGSPGDEPLRRGRGGGLLNKVFRRA